MLFLSPNANPHIFLQVRKMLTNTYDTCSFNICSLNVRGGRSKVGIMAKELSEPKYKKEVVEVCLLQEFSFEEAEEKFIAGEMNWSQAIIHSGDNVRGVAIGFSKAIAVVTEEIVRFGGGRGILWRGKVNSAKVTLVNIHAPCEQPEQIPFFIELLQCMQKHERKEYPFILGGDFNIVFNESGFLHSKGNPSLKKRSIEKVTQILESFSLIDVLQTQHPKPRYTWRCGNTARVLDYIFVPDAWQGNVVASAVVDCPWSDHDYVFLRLESKNVVPRGRGVYRMNVQHLEDPNFVQLLMTAIKQQLEINSHLTDKCLIWELLKQSLMRTAIAFSIRVAKEKREEEERLKKEIDTAREAFIRDGDLESAVKLSKVEKQLHDVLSHKQQGSKIRARCQWMAAGEKNTKWFFDRERSQAVKRTILKLETEDGIKVDKNEIQEAIADYFEKLYAARPDPDFKEKRYDEFLRHPELPQLSPEDVDFLAMEIQEEEIVAFLKTGNKAGKVGGYDGIPYEVYLHPTLCPC